MVIERVRACGQPPTTSNLPPMSAGIWTWSRDPSAALPSASRTATTLRMTREEEAQEDLYLFRGLKPGPSIGLYGTTEVVPFPILLHSRFDSLYAVAGGGARATRAYFADAMASRTWPFAFFRAAWAWGRVAPAASITRATGVLLPEAFRAWVADSRVAPVARSRIPMARCRSFSFFGATLTMRLP